MGRGMIDWLRSKNMAPVIDLGDKPLPLVIRRHPRAKRMTLRLSPDGSEVCVTLPSWGRTQEAMEFAQARKDWLTAQLAKLPAAEPPAPGGVLRYRGNVLRIAWARDLPRQPRIEDGVLMLDGPDTSLISRLRRWLEGEALRLMSEDMAVYCARAAVAQPPPVRLSRAQRRWGSCAGDGTIRLNWRLVQAPDAVRRSVVANEVAHLVHFHHGPQFHALLRQIFDGDIEDSDRWLKREGRSLYAAFG